MKTYQLNNDFLLIGENPIFPTKPHLAVIVPPPEVLSGWVAKWKTELNPISDVHFGEPTTGEWELLKDYRNKTLYVLKTGEVYQGSFSGIGDLPEGVTDKRPELEELSHETIINRKKAYISQFLDAKAKEYGYDSINTAVTYASEPSVPKFQKEGIAFREWRSKVWAKGYSLIDEVLSGKRKIPTDEELTELLPVFEVNYEE